MRLHHSIPAGLAGLILMIASGCATQTETGSSVGIPNDEHIPSATQMERAQEAYEAGRYEVALEYYRLAARWADKFGQFNVGLMILKGQGTEKDIPRGWAWLELAAERDYPQMVEPAEDVWELMNPEQRREGRQILEEELLPRYGDEVAVQRTARHMERERRDATGSNTGSKAALGRLRIYQGNQSYSGEEYYADAKWDFEQIIQTEQRFLINLHRGSVSLRDFETLDDDETSGEDENQENDPSEQ
jgi:TPR repeat protein